LYLSEDVGYGGMKVAGVKEAEGMTGVEAMTGNKGTKNDVRKERRHHCNAGYMRSN
jgi:hypothetical protein